MRRNILGYALSLCFIPSPLVVLNIDKFGGEAHALNANFLLPPQHSRLDSILTEKQYFATLHDADEVTFKNEIEVEFLLLLSEQQKQAYENLASLNERKAYIEYYWKATNPNPLLPENDWLSDFLKRRAYARKNFPYWKPPYFDDRGKYYIKYGKPSFRHEDGGGFHRNSTKGPRYVTIQNESWSYENVERNFLVHFVKDGVIFREVNNLVSFLTTGKRVNPESQLILWGELVKERAAVSPVLGRAMARIHELETAQSHAAQFPNSLTVLTEEYAKPEALQRRIAEQAKLEVLKAFETAPPAAHDEIKAINKLEFYNDLAQFRAPHGSTRMEIALLSPLKKNLVKNYSSDSNDTLKIEYRCLLQNQWFDPVGKDSTANKFPAKLAALENFPNAVGKLIVLASPQQGDLTLQIKDERNGKLGFSRQPITIRDFRGDSLMISDLQFLTEVANDNQKRLLPAIAKQDRMVAPYPFEKVRKSTPLLCYFEVYNLKSLNEETYEVVYKIISVNRPEQNIFKQVAQALTSDKDVAVSVSYTRPISDDAAEELIGIDLSRVAKGAYRLEITVTDTRTKTITAKAEKEIVVD
jgi:GWxTD domain-containing protein